MSLRAEIEKDYLNVAHFLSSKSPQESCSIAFTIFDPRKYSSIIGGDLFSYVERRLGLSASENFWNELKRRYQPDIFTTCIDSTFPTIISSNRKKSTKICSFLSKKDHRNLGIYLGIPKTAVDYFCDVIIRKNDPFSVPYKIENHKYGKYLRFVPSKENWEEEFRDFCYQIDSLKSHRRDLSIFF